MTRSSFLTDYRRARVLQRATIEADRAHDPARFKVAESAWYDFSQPSPRSGVRLCGRNTDTRHFHPAAFALITRGDRPFSKVATLIERRRAGYPADALDRAFLSDLRARAARKVA